MERLERKLEEAYQHMKPYMDEGNAPELFAMCKRCGKWCGTSHDYEECRDTPCFKNWLGYSYLRWETSWEV